VIVGYRQGPSKTGLYSCATTSVRTRSDALSAHARAHPISPAPISDPSEGS